MKILLVEDDEGIADFKKKGLREESYSGKLNQGSIVEIFIELY